MVYWRRSTRQIEMHARLQDCELFPNNEMNDNGDLVHFTLMAESELVKTKETLSDPK